MDSLNGKKTSFATWKMAERVLRTLSQDPTRDSVSAIIVCTVYMVQVYIRNLASIGKNKITEFFLEIMRGFSREFLHYLFRTFFRNFPDQFLSAYRDEVENPREDIRI